MKLNCCPYECFHLVVVANLVTTESSKYARMFAVMNTAAMLRCSAFYNWHNNVIQATTNPFCVQSPKFASSTTVLTMSTP